MTTPIDLDEKEKETISDIVPDEYKKRAIKIADEHVEWFVGVIKPLLKTFAENICCAFLPSRMGRG